MNRTLMLTQLLLLIKCPVTNLALVRQLRFVRSAPVSPYLATPRKLFTTLSASPSLRASSRTVLPAPVRVFSPHISIISSVRIQEVGEVMLAHCDYQERMKQLNDKQRSSFFSVLQRNQTVFSNKVKDRTEGLEWSNQWKSTNINPDSQCNHRCVQY